MKLKLEEGLNFPQKPFLFVSINNMLLRLTGWYNSLEALADTVKEMRRAELIPEGFWQPSILYIIKKTDEYYVAQKLRNKQYVAIAELRFSCIKPIQQAGLKI